MTSPHTIVDTALRSNELTFSTSRSSGPGGQNVNKVNSKVTLRWSVINSGVITEEEKSLLMEKLSAIITKDGTLMLSAQENRSQLENKSLVLAKLEAMIQKAMRKKKVRRPTKPSKSSARKRIESKKRTGEKKQWRQKL